MNEVTDWMTSNGEFETNENGDRSEAWLHLKNNENVETNKWWNLHFPDKCLSIFSPMLNVIPLTSASNERTWSIRTAVHTKTRNRFQL